MQTTFIVGEETNNSSAQFPVDHLERYLKAPPAIRPLFLATFLPNPLSHVPKSFFLILETMPSPSVIWMLINYQHYIQNVQTYQKLGIK